MTTVTSLARRSDHYGQTHRLCIRWANWQLWDQKLSKEQDRDLGLPWAECRKNNS